MKKVEELKDLRAQNAPFLYKEILTLNQKLAELEFKVSLRKVKNFREIRRFKKRIARIWTILGEYAMQELLKEENGK